MNPERKLPYYEVSKLRVQIEICVDCGQSFQISGGERRFYESKTLPLPKRCKACREIKKKWKERKR